MASIRRNKRNIPSDINSGGQFMPNWIHHEENHFMKYTKGVYYGHKRKRKVVK